VADGSLPEEGPEAGRLNRRTLFGLATAAVGTATVATFWFRGFLDPNRASRTEATKPGAGHVTLTDAEWAALAAAQERLLPSDDDGPGAREVNAIGYLDAALDDPSTYDETRTSIREGAKRLDEGARGQGAASFAVLPGEGQDRVLHGFETSDDGLRFLRDLLAFTFEAFLGDPIYGGNPGEIGWKWAHHKSGVPRPVRRP
jgi:hypothetical protein